MKVIRLKQGYRITLSDSEFEALKLMLDNPDALERDAKIEDELRRLGRLHGNATI